MNKLFFSKSFYLFLWKKDRVPFLWMIAKFILFFLAVIVLTYFIMHMYVSEKSNLELERKKFILIQKKLLNVKNNQSLYENNIKNINEMKKNNFFIDVNEENIFNIFRKITNDIDHPLVEYFNVEPKHLIINFTEKKSLLGAKLKIQANFWHENEFINFLNKVDNLNKILREEECEFFRTSKKEDYINSEIYLKNIEPSLEVKCTIGLYWVSY